MLEYVAVNRGVVTSRPARGAKRLLEVLPVQFVDASLRLSPDARQPVKTLLTVRWKILDRQEDQAAAQRPLHPAAAPQLCGDARPATTGHLQRDPLDGIPPVQVRIGSWHAIRLMAVEAGPAHLGQLEHAPHCQSVPHLQVFGRLFADRGVDRGFPLNACGIRCSSMRCQHPFKKSISSAWRPIFCSSSATRPSGQRRLPQPERHSPDPGGTHAASGVARSRSLPAPGLPLRPQRLAPVAEPLSA